MGWACPDVGIRPRVSPGSDADANAGAFAMARQDMRSRMHAGSQPNTAAFRDGPGPVGPRMHTGSDVHTAALEAAPGRMGPRTHAGRATKTGAFGSVSADIRDPMHGMSRPNARHGVGVRSQVRSGPHAFVLASALHASSRA
jgi:hypothetical protein